MEKIFFKMIAQKTVEGKSILIAVIPDNMLGENLPSIVECQAFLMHSTVYTGTYPQIKINTDTIADRADLKGYGIDGIITSEMWYIENKTEKDILGISLKPKK